MMCVKSVRYSIKLNGRLLDDFLPSRGLQQGDPLSPFLFLFVADALSALLSKSVSEGSLNGVSICRGAPVISHLLFADDSLLFFKAEVQQAERVKQVLVEYGQATGQLINPEKCSIFFGETCPIRVQEDIKTVLGVSR